MEKSFGLGVRIPEETEEKKIFEKMPREKSSNKIPAKIDNDSKKTLRNKKMKVLTTNSYRYFYVVKHV